MQVKDYSNHHHIILSAVAIKQSPVYASSLHNIEKKDIIFYLRMKQ